MSTNFPTSLDTFTNPIGTNPLTAPDHAGQHSNINDSVAALEAKVGVNSSAVTTSLDYIVKHPIIGDAVMTQVAAFGTASPVLLSASTSVPAGFLSFVHFTAPVNLTTTTVSFIVTVAAASSGSGTGVALYSVDASDNLTQIALAASTTAFTATGMKALTWAASAALTRGTRYAVGFLNVLGSGSPSLASPAPLAAQAGVGLFSRAPRWGAQSSAGSQTSLPASFAIGSQANSTSLYWAELS